MTIRRRPIRARNISARKLKLLVSDMEIQRHAEHVEYRVAAQLASERLARANKFNLH